MRLILNALKQQQWTLYFHSVPIDERRDDDIYLTTTCGLTAWKWPTRKLDVFNWRSNSLRNEILHNSNLLCRLYLAKKLTSTLVNGPEIVPFGDEMEASYSDNGKALLDIKTCKSKCKFNFNHHIIFYFFLTNIW